MPSLSADQELDDQSFLKQFEALTLDPIHFLHVGHLRLAWLYLRENDAGKAAELTCEGIKRYAESLGANTKFHVTMTDAFVRIISHRLDQLKDKSWPSFISNNTDLVEDASSVLTEYYSDTLLFSEAARMTLIHPDVKPLPST